MGDALNQPDVARAIATIAHKGQTDKAGHPYIEHPAAVAATFVGDDSAILKSIAWLHDVLEDTEITVDDLVRAGVSHIVIIEVERLTHLPNESRDRYYERIRESDRARAVKIADIRHNSDPRRLALLDADTQRRLIMKYAEALVALGA